MKTSRWIATFTFILALGLPGLASAQIAPATDITSAPTPFPGPRHQPDMVTAGNLWTVTAYRDAFRHTPYQTKQNLCYFYLGKKGTHDMYVWISTSYPKWWGFAEKEGDQVRQFGNFAPATHPVPLERWWEVNWRGHTSMQFELVLRGKGRIVPRDVATGHINASIEPGFARVFANMKMVRTGKCLPHLALRIKSVVDGSLPASPGGDVRISDALIDLLVNQSAEVPQQKRSDGTIATSPFDSELPPTE